MTPTIRIESWRFSPRTAFGKEKGSGGRKVTRTFGSWPRASLSASASHNTTSSIPASRSTATQRTGVGVSWDRSPSAKGTARKGNRQIWLAAFYEDDFVKVGGVGGFEHFRAALRL